MSDKSGQPVKLELEIYSIPIRLRAPADEHERLRRAAKHVDQTMRDLVSNNATIETSRVAIQAAFLIASEYFKVLDETASVGGAPSSAVQRVDAILKQLNDSMDELDAAFGPTDLAASGAELRSAQSTGNPTGTSTE